MGSLKELWYIDYEKFFLLENAIKTSEKATCIHDLITYDWADIYRKNTKATPNICLFNYGDFYFLHDDTDELVYHKKVLPEEVPESRIIAAYGFSKSSPEKRNKSRMQGYLGPTSKIYAHFGNNYDKGHFIANATGGPMEINLFPQKRDINRGWSIPGRRYREMEKYVAAHPETFSFARPFYNDFSLRPIYLEFGYIASSGELVLEIFENT